MGIKILVNNKKAFHDFEVMDKFEAGIELVGTEVKSLREGRGNLKDGWVDVRSGEAFLKDVHISHYTHGNQMNHEEKRVRKLLLHGREIEKLRRKTEEQGLTCVPLKMYLKKSFIKVEIALAKGKKNYDKRESAKKKDANRDIERAMRRG